LAKLTALEVTIIQTRPRLKGFVRTLVRFWMGRRGRALSGKFLSRWLDCEIPAAAPRPDLIVASGGKAVFAARSLAVKFSAPLIFIGERKPYPSQWFHTVFTPSAAETGVSDVSIELIPTQVTRERVEQAAASWSERPEGKLWAMVIGGVSPSHRYRKSDWEALAAAMNSLARREGLRWLVTTSRRTGAIAESRLRASLALDTLAANVWWADKPEKKMHAFLGASECVVVTQDSITMVTEAVASSRPVLVVKPHTVVFRKKSFFSKYIEALATSKRIVTMDIISLATFVLGEAHLVVRNTAVNDELAETTLNRLSWIPEPDET
jgi:mitochondrial fission protein ELM1